MKFVEKNHYKQKFSQEFLYVENHFFDIIKECRKMPEFSTSD